MRCGRPFARSISCGRSVPFSSGGAVSAADPIDAPPWLRVGLGLKICVSTGRYEESGMPVAAMNHFTVLSDDLEATRRFYCDLFGFKVGWRPPFQFPGWW